MPFAQLNESLTSGTQLPDGNCTFDTNHYCPAHALTPAEAALFRVVPLVATEQPPFSPITERCYRDGCEKVGDEWRYKWTVEALSAPAIAANLEAARAAQRAAIRAERDRRKFNGVFVSGKWIHADTYSRTQWIGMVMMGASVPAIEWTTMDGTTIMTSQTLASQVFNATATLDATLFAFARSLIALVDASSDPASVNITAGWPATFEG